MSLLTTLIIVAMVLTFLENTFVALVAFLIYRRQRQANAEMEKGIKQAIEDVKGYMKSPDILGALKKGMLKTMNGWVGGKRQGVNKTGKALTDAVGGMDLLRRLKKADKDDKLYILGEYAMEKYAEYQAQADAKKDEPPPMLTPEEFKAVKESQTTPDEYAKAFAEAVNAQGPE